MRALIVDDDSIVRDACTLVLEAEGHGTVAVESAQTALEMLDGSSFEIVLLDVKMPVRDGYSLMCELKQRWPGMKIIVMSGFSTSETVSESYRLGAETFLAKPFEPDELLAALRHAMGEEGRNDGNESTGHR